MSTPPLDRRTMQTRRVRLSGGEIEYALRPMGRARGLRVTMDARRGVIVTVPPATRRGWARPEPLVEAFLRERERWLWRHIERHERTRAEIAARGGIVDGGLVRYRGELHRLAIRAARPGERRSTVARSGEDDADALVVEVTTRDRRALARVLRDWLRERAEEIIGREIDRHAAALGVTPAAVALRDPRSRWGSASKEGRLMFSWRLVLAPPQALETVVVHELAHLRVFGHGPRFWAVVASRVPDHARWRKWLRDHSQELHAALDESDSGRP